MKRSAFLLLLFLLFSWTLLADDKTSQLEQQLRAEGLYRGEIDGQENAELTAALRRYQIREGLDVTGLFDEATAKALANEPTPSPTVSGREDNQARITDFLKSYLHAGEGKDIDAQLQYFRFPLPYFENPNASKEFVRKDTAAYVRRWPIRHYLLIEPIAVTGVSPSEWKVIFSIAYDVKNGSKGGQGRTANEVTLRDERGALHIASIRERHLRD